MKIRHRIAYNRESVSKEFVDFLEEKKAKFENTNSNIGVAYLYEEDEWKDDLFDFLKKEKTISTIDSIYTKGELEKAQWFTIRSKYRFEYPQPEESFGYESQTYENSKYCGGCGCGLKQVDSFRINKTPKWGSRNFLMINWIEDELFTNANARECIISEKITGLKFLDVINNHKNIAFEDLYQIYVEEVLVSGLVDLNRSVKEVLECKNCGKTKYIYSGKGLIYRKEIFEGINCDIAKTFETYGDGNMCARNIIISKKFYTVLKNNKLDKDLEFEPIILI